MNIIKKFMSNRGKLAHFINRRAISLHKSFENLNYNFDTNGELNVLKKLSSFKGEINTVFDVGANRGNWATMFNERFPEAQIYSFEILPITYEHLEAKVKGVNKINCYNFGLSNVEKDMTINYSPKSDGLTTLVPNFMEEFHGGDTIKYDVKVITGDCFCQNEKIISIDFLKIDVEGHENNVLEGLKGMLENGNIKIIQFEYGFINVATHFLLKDFYKLLGQYGMKIGKIYPKYVDFREYRYSDENFYGPNYLAVHESEKDIIAALKK